MIWWRQQRKKKINLFNGLQRHEKLVAKVSGKKCAKEVTTEAGLEV